MTGETPPIPVITAEEDPGLARAFAQEAAKHDLVAVYGRLGWGPDSDFFAALLPKLDLDTARQSPVSWDVVSQHPSYSQGPTRTDALHKAHQAYFSAPADVSNQI